MSGAEIAGVVLGALSISMLLLVLYLLKRVYTVVRRDQVLDDPKGRKQKSP